MTITKRNGSLEEFNISKIKNSVRKAFNACSVPIDEETLDRLTNSVNVWDKISVEEIQDQLERLLETFGYHKVAKAFMIYRSNQSEIRFEEERLMYMEEYARSHENAASSSETDANANVTMKNVANLEGEVYKTKNRKLQRRRMKKQLMEMFPEIADQYEIDLNHHML